MTRYTVARARAILEIFAEAQALAHEVSDEKHGNMRAHHAERKRADNAEQHKRRQFDPAKRAARNAKKRARAGDLVKPRCKDDAERLARRRARQRAYKQRLKAAA